MTLKAVGAAAAIFLHVVSFCAVYLFESFFMVKLVSGMGPAAVVLVWQLTCATTQKDKKKNRPE